MRVAWNVVAVAIWLSVVAVAVWRWRTHRRVTNGHFFAMLFGWMIGGVVLPVGPIVWLAWEATHRHPDPTAV